MTHNTSAHSCSCPRSCKRKSHGARTVVFPVRPFEPEVAPVPGRRRGRLASAQPVLRPAASQGFSGPYEVTTTRSLEGQARPSCVFEGVGPRKLRCMYWTLGSHPSGWVNVIAHEGDLMSDPTMVGSAPAPRPPTNGGALDLSDDALAEIATRQTFVAATFVDIVDTLVGDFDVIEVLTLLSSRCVGLLDAAAAGILIADSDGHLHVVGASTEQIELLELFQVQNNEGPCLDCFRTGQTVLHSDDDIGTRWPQFAAFCLDAGFASVCAVPLRLRTQILGCLNIFVTGPGGLSDSDVALAQALADVASITIVQDQAIRNAATREGHLQYALNSRIAIEQAKGMIITTTQPKNSTSHAMSSP